MNISLPMLGAVPVLSCAQSAVFEKDFFAVSGAREADFMQRAAHGVARETVALFAEIRSRELGSVAVLAGAGRNAADALLAARLLQREKRGQAETGNPGKVVEIKILLARPLGEMSVPARTALDALLADGAVARDWRGAADADAFLGGGADVLLDGLLGYNFQPPLRAPLDAIIAWANACVPRFLLRVAVDLPSGMGDGVAFSGSELLVFAADATVACGLLKAPLLAQGYASLRGRLRFADICFPASVLPPANVHVVGEEFLGRSPLCRQRKPLSDKRDFGHLLILGGSRAMPGALLMNVRAALRAGVGLVTAFCPESVHAAFAAAAPEAMWVPWPEAPNGTLALEGECLLREFLPRATALLAGSGMGRGGEESVLLRSVVSRAMCPLILDAGGLFPDIVEAASRREGAPALVLLPHAGEYVRIAGQAAPHEACARWRALIALKGTPTRVVDAGREIVICAGGPALARGGSGDLLAGITGALFAQRLCPCALQTLVVAVAWHGAAADRAARAHGAHGLTAQALLGEMGAVLLACE
ncbi:MAG: NAD(P)H-hydrate dehydratase [Puniceicoccales bacterium]|jgi:NAD(P)H-hydrate epimerase|nr:NAD(P)H-hydrate dehydratase [Puniceicoccales bacterium]